MDEHSRDEQFFSIVGGLENQINWSSGDAVSSGSPREGTLFISCILFALSSVILFFIDRPRFDISSAAYSYWSLPAEAWRMLVHYPIFSVSLSLFVVTGALFVRSVVGRSRG